MAFLAKNCKCFTCFPSKKLKFRDVERTITISQFAKLSPSAFFNPISSRNYSATKNNDLLSATSWNHRKNKIFNASMPYFMSTDSHVANFKITTPGLEKHIDSHVIGTETELSNQVLFTQSEIPNSSREILDTASTLTTEHLSTVVDVLEPSLASLGLGCWYTPVGLVQQYLEWLHMSAHWPWWLSIVAATVTFRILMFPVFIKTQKNAAKFANHMPQLQYLQAKFSEARRTGNAFEATKYANDIMRFMKEHDINPMKNALWPLAQAPVFISFFLGLRNMAKLPVESMKDGGFSWITDLTIPDPYYVMPVLSCATLYIILKIGAESGVRLENMKLSRYFISALPVLVFPFCMHFQSAVLFYWCTNNFITLGLVLVMKIDHIRRYFGIPKIQKPDPQFVPKKKKFIAAIKDAYQDQRILNAIDERARIDEIRFRKAGTGPIPRTYAYDPTKPRPGQAAAAAAAKRSASTSANTKS